MPCYNPKAAWESGGKGRKSISFNFRTTTPDYLIGCGKCEGCRVRARTDWATRIYHESQMWDQNCFLTLTYDDAHLPEKIIKEDIQLFIRKLRKEYSKKTIRYFAVGEYGEQTRRPHYHAIIFNEDFLSSRYQFNISDSMYGNSRLQRIWGKGQVTISEFNHARANYTAGYATKKINDTDTFSLMSCRPPLGRTWVQKHHDNLRRNETIIIGGKELPIPKVYLQWLRGVESYDHIKENLKETIKPMTRQQLDAKRINYMSKQKLRKETV